MDAMTYSTARANLAGVMNRVCEDHEPLIITRKGDQSVVMLSIDDYKALEETAYLLHRPPTLVACWRLSPSSMRGRLLSAS